MPKKNLGAGDSKTLYESGERWFIFNLNWGFKLKFENFRKAGGRGVGSNFFLGGEGLLPLAFFNGTALKLGMSISMDGFPFCLSNTPPNIQAGVSRANILDQNQHGTSDLHFGQR